MTVTKTISTSGTWFALSGTYAEVVQALEDEKVPEHKVRGFSFVSTGNCIVLVNRHQEERWFTQHIPMLIY